MSLVTLMIARLLLCMELKLLDKFLPHQTNMSAAAVAVKLRKLAEWCLHLPLQTVLTRSSMLYKRRHLVSWMAEPSADCHQRPRAEGHDGGVMGLQQAAFHQSDSAACFDYLVAS
jgi:hypothetical protein